MCQRRGEIPSFLFAIHLNQPIENRACIFREGEGKGIGLPLHIGFHGGYTAAVGIAVCEIGNFRKTVEMGKFP